MSIKRLWAIYFSPTGTTKATVLAIAKATGIPFENIDLTLPNARESYRQSFGTDDLVVVGLPVYAGRIPQNLDEFFSGLKGNCTPATAVVVFGNRDYNDALIEMKMRLEDRGFRVRSAAAFIGQHTHSDKIATGRPDTSDLSIAEHFGQMILSGIDENTIPGDLKVKGNYPFSWLGFDPKFIPAGYPPRPRLITDDNCEECKLCIQNCPWRAIAPDRSRDYSRCMICYRCLKMCPSHAIHVTGEEFLNILPQFEAMCSRRCEPELFLPKFQ